MNIVVVGAGAIGSLFGALLSPRNTVVLVGRTPHVTAIQHHGLSIQGKTRLHVQPTAVDALEKVTIPPDLILITVKAYDTEYTAKHIVPFLQKQTMVLSLQNGLDNIETLQCSIPRNHLLAGVTTHGAMFNGPGVITHTGTGTTILGELTNTISPRLQTLLHTFNQAGIKTQASSDIQKELWRKAIINSSINPLTAFLHCNNGYILKNPILEKCVDSICEESTNVALAQGFDLTIPEMIQQTKEVIRNTAKNYSSMLQSIQQGKRTEIDTINGKIVALGTQHNIKTPLNEILIKLIQGITKP
jgi:2-dehydropantoate 2-reductase